MIYNNIEIIHTKPIEIVHNNYENNYEILFAYIDNIYVQKFTYPTNIINNFGYLLKDKKKINIECESFLLYSFYYQISFAHFVYQCLPKLKYYLEEFYDAKIVIPKSSYNYFVEEILFYCNINKDNIIFLEEDIVYNFKILHTFSHNEYTMDINPDIIYVFDKIRSCLNITENKNPYRKIYLKKDGEINKKYGNSEVGVSRVIINEEELTTYLKSEGFEIITLGDKNILEKNKLLEDVDILITQIGANCINFLFSNSPKKILFLSNEFPIGKDFYINMTSNLNKSVIQHDIFCYRTEINYDNKNHTNGQFIVNMVDIKKYLNK